MTISFESGLILTIFVEEYVDNADKFLVSKI